MRYSGDSYWRELPWRMTEDKAAAWAKSEGREIEKIKGSAEERRPTDQEPSHDGP